MNRTNFAKALQVLGVPIRCEGCGWIIDPTTCHCGESIPGGHCDNHAPVPAGCTCFYTDAEARRNPNFVHSSIGPKFLWKHLPGEDKCSCQFPSVWLSYPRECQNCMKVLP